MMTGREAVGSAKGMLEKSCIAEPEAKAKVIVAHVLDIGYGDIYMCNHVSQKHWDVIAEMTHRCMRGEPVEYVTGKAYFRHIVLDVLSDVLIPRIETELVAEQAIDLIRQKGYSSAIDICTGSGCIGISLAVETKALVHACDISEKALAMARRNAKNNGADKMLYFSSNMFESITLSYDVIICNPPYVNEQEYMMLDDSVRMYEPSLALVAGDGYPFYRNIAKNGMQCLNGGGALVLEIGATQAKNVMELLAQSGFVNVECKKDYAGRDRIVCAYKQ